eukprot:CAMPEP_0202875340 /NCGR_PEP_ID=MMETSP1391-20130828/27125_1 /ASSEMBLY_ACC=CAM_ASM_000867 /TAXON_ID=1034604 /ORGANISM="Chlamydomonas leiostraca, Strain SAG 11-49" /LENGTH=50 /DNA_ID=CAMNT_0049556993 /DNA_START=59 /DNA_END=208 /DNA_ORIENTATION=+
MQSGGHAGTSGGMRIIFAVECTVGMQQCWRDFRGKYVEPLLRAVDKKELG